MKSDNRQRKAFSSFLAGIVLILLLSLFGTFISEAGAATVSSSRPSINNRDLIVTFYDPFSTAQVANLRAIPGAAVTILTSRSLRVVLPPPPPPRNPQTASDQEVSLPPDPMEQLEALEAQGLATVEMNAPVEAKFYIDDPEVAVYAPHSTELGYTQVFPWTAAFDYTFGSPQVPIAVVDLNPDPGEANFDMPPAAININISPSNRSGLHASQVKSIIFSRTGNGIGGFGVCPDCTQYAFTAGGNVTVGGSGGLQSIVSTVSDVLVLLELAKQANPSIVTMSLGAPFSSYAMERAVLNFTESGTHFFSAAGNEGAPWPQNPAGLHGAIAVGATDDYETVAPFSNSGVAIVAPGAAIPVPYFNPITSSVLYREEDGTSFATPFAAGSLGLIKSYAEQNASSLPEISAMNSLQKYDYFKQLLFRSATDIGLPGFDARSGHGLVNPKRAIEMMLEDNLPPLASDVSQGFSEWKGQQNTPANPFFGKYQERITGKTPRAKFRLDVPSLPRFGSCYLPGAFEIHSPKVKTKVKDTNVEVVSMQGDRLQTRTTYDLSIIVEQPISFTPLSTYWASVSWFICPIFGMPRITLDIGYDANSNNDSVLDATYQLRDGGYERVDIRRSTPSRVFVGNVAALGLPLLFQDFLSTLLGTVVMDIAKDIYKPIIRTVIEGSFHAEMLRMTDGIVEKSLSFSPHKTADHFRLRTQDYQAPQIPQMKSPRVSGQMPQAVFTHDASREQSHSTYGVRLPVQLPLSSVPPAAGLGPTGPLSYNLNLQDVSAYTHENLYNGMLRYLYDAGRFQYPENQRLKNDVMTSTTADSGSVEIAMELQATAPPVVSYYPTPINGYYGEVQVTFAAQTDIHGSLGAPFSGSLPFLYRVPFTTRDVYKHLEDEKRFNEDYTNRYGQRITPDFWASEAVDITGYSHPSVSKVELELFLKHTMGPHVVRQISALASWETDADKNLGSFGCLEQLVHTIQFYSYQYNGDGFVTVQSAEDCWDLNLGRYFAGQTPNASSVNGFAQRQLRMIQRVSTIQPTAAFSGNLESFLEIHPNDPNRKARGVKFATISTNGGELRTSINGYFETDYNGEGINEFVVVEDLWQIARSSSNGRGELWWPNDLERSDPKLSTLSRPRHQVQLNIGDLCLPYAEIELAYQNGLPPIVLRRHEGGSFGTRSVFRERDVWTTQFCSDGYGEGEGTTGPITPVEGQRPVATPIGGPVQTPPDSE